ncbi:Demethylsterigmatocystin 6-O-methyltransferase [Talaromyces islandicus]|uniref:Demethylsterigmatocystin 6-O-methyltransferase n=1 Tax=Talaromyces islandicus TaxID=28573 RepID=A0A0U1LM74_TALIS|nr:Demethylsterigmatocystin 6-O-methyltransferase [Talaromyces islandicus]
MWYINPKVLSTVIISKFPIENDNHPVTKVSDLIKQLSAIEKSSENGLYENDKLRSDAAHIVKLEKPEDVILLNNSQPAQVAAVKIGVDLELFHYLGDGPGVKSVEELAARTGAEAELLIRILRLLVAINWADQVDENSFKPSRITNTLKDSKLMQASVNHMYLTIPIYAKLPEYFKRTNYKSPTDVHNGPFQYACNVQEPAFDYWAKDPVATDTFNTFMTGVRAGRKNWVQWFPVQEHLISGSTGKDEDPLIVDIGGGRGHGLNTFIKTFPTAKGRFVLEDLPVVIDDVNNRNAGIEAVKHSFFDEQPVQGARVYFMHHVLHD